MKTRKIVKTTISNDVIIEQLQNGRCVLARPGVLTMKKFKILLFNIDNKKFSLKEVKGYQIDSIAFVYHECPYWSVIELESGLCICKGKTKQDALNEYQKDDMKEKIAKAHKTDTYKRLKNIFEEMKGQN